MKLRKYKGINHQLFGAGSLTKFLKPIKFVTDNDKWRYNDIIS